MLNLGQSYRLTNAQKKAASIRMKADYAKKKAGTKQKKFDFKPAENMLSMEPPPVEQAKAQQASFDQQRFGELQYRRGLIAAIECIIRELR